MFTSPPLSTPSGPNDDGPQAGEHAPHQYSRHRRLSRVARGFNEVRKGLPFNPDNDDWNYERGRCFGFIAPLDMPLRIGRTLNPSALKLAEKAFSRRLLI